MISNYWLQQKKDSSRELLIFNISKVLRFLLYWLVNFLKGFVKAFGDALKLFLRF